MPLIVTWADYCTVRIARSLVTEPSELATVTVNVAPLSAALVAGMVYLSLVAPEISAPFLCHWYVSVGEPAPVTVKVTG